MSAEAVLRQAAGLIREHGSRDPRWRGYIAASKGWLDPAVALAVADWLSMQADHAAGQGAVCGSCVDQALAVARAYLEDR